MTGSRSGGTQSAAGRGTTGRRAGNRRRCGRRRARPGHGTRGAASPRLQRPRRACACDASGLCIVRCTSPSVVAIHSASASTHSMARVGERVTGEAHVGTKAQDFLTAPRRSSGTSRPWARPRRRSSPGSGCSGSSPGGRPRRSSSWPAAPPRSRSASCRSCSRSISRITSSATCFCASFVVVDAAAVLRADVVALAVERGRVVHDEEDLQDLAQRDLGRIEFQLDHLRMAGAAGADLLVARIASSGRCCSRIRHRSRPGRGRTPLRCTRSSRRPARWFRFAVMAWTWKLRQ